MNEVTGPTGQRRDPRAQLPNALHSQATMVAKLDGISLLDAYIRGLRTYAEQKQAEPDFKARVAAAPRRELARQASSGIRSNRCLGLRVRQPTPCGQKTAAAKKPASELSPPERTILCGT
jgi:hypothetical protein